MKNLVFEFEFEFVFAYSKFDSKFDLLSKAARIRFDRKLEFEFEFVYSKFDLLSQFY
ncbi:hypothetical protein F511_06979 [Dorcoceras hygrometricum]|uniref:Uncharacterized protein n=1 Tax=Dorcoceras hygrometricum TaxID=472368 RepID=A0A2Z7D1U8_9LAMI|nr:hypothetical protein F511_06979 [Dorcoceras hygrometricum]